MTEDRCAMAERCPGYDRRTKTAPTVRHNPLCDDDLRIAERDIRALRLDWRDLADQLIPSIGQWGDGQPPALGEHPMPLRGDVDALQREIWHVLTTWEEIIRDMCGLSIHESARQSQADVDTAVAILAPRIASLALIPAAAVFPTGCESEISHMTGVEAITAMGRLHGRARHHIGIDQDVRYLPGHCRHCSRPALRQQNGSDTVYCDVCDDRQTRDDYEAYGNLFLRKDVA